MCAFLSIILFLPAQRLVKHSNTCSSVCCRARVTSRALLQCSTGLPLQQRMRSVIQATRDRVRCKPTLIFALACFYCAVLISITAYVVHLHVPLRRMRINVPRLRPQQKPSILHGFPSQRLTRQAVNASPSESRLTPLNMSDWLPLEMTCIKRKASSHDLACCLRKIIGSSMPLSLASIDSPILQNRFGFPENFTRLLPSTPLRSRFRHSFRTCAVVSSAATMLRHRVGNEIDKHEAVFRFNAAPTAKYEAHVGTKTTVRIFNSAMHVEKFSNVVREMREAETSDEIFFMRHVVNSSLTQRAFDAWNSSPRRSLDKYARLRRSYPETSIYVNHPLFSTFVGIEAPKRLRLSHSARLKSFSSGMQGVILALFLCERVTAYDIAEGMSWRPDLIHYYDKPRKKPFFYKGHPIEDERFFLQSIGRQRNGTSIYDIDLTSYDCKQL